MAMQGKRLCKSGKSEGGGSAHCAENGDVGGRKRAALRVVVCMGRRGWLAGWLADGMRARAAGPHARRVRETQRRVFLH